MSIIFKKLQFIKLNHEETTIDSSSDKEKMSFRFINRFLNSTIIGKYKTKKNETNGTPVRISGIEPIHAIMPVSTESPIGEMSFENDIVLYRICGGFFGYIHPSFHFFHFFAFSLI
jgi:hypothetical protein